MYETKTLKLLSRKFNQCIIGAIAPLLLIISWPMRVRDFGMTAASDKFLLRLQNYKKFNELWNILTQMKFQYGSGFMLLLFSNIQVNTQLQPNLELESELS